jgi:hypothetical protein
MAKEAIVVEDTGWKMDMMLKDQAALSVFLRSFVKGRIPITHPLL